MKFSVLRLLGEEAARPAQDVGPDHALDRIEHRRVPHQLVEEGEQQVRLVAQRLALTVAALAASKRLEPAGGSVGRRSGESARSGNR